MTDFFEGLDTDLSTVTMKASEPRTTYPCQNCAGTGTWVSPLGRKRGKCHICKGKGHFFTSHRDRMINRAKTRQSKAKRLAEAQGGFHETNPGLITSLSGMTDWNDFARSLVEQFNSRGFLSEKQTAAANRMIAKVEATRQAKDQAREENSVQIDLTPIRDMFDAAHTNGHKRPKYRAEDLVISRAPDHGRNAGALYVKMNDEYQGKITSSNVFYPTREADSSTVDKLKVIAENPKEAAVRHGQRTGSCSCCGRELTNQVSIDLGIGPICAGRWGL